MSYSFSVDAGSLSRSQLNGIRIALAIAWRQIHVMITKPSLILPSLIFPLFFFAAFAGGLSAVGDAPNFNYPDYTTFQYVFVLMQSAIFGGVFTGFSIAAWGS